MMDYGMLTVLAEYGSSGELMAKPDILSLDEVFALFKVIRIKMYCLKKQL